MKILINLVIPSVSASYDVLVPAFLPIKEVVKLMVEGTEELSNLGYRRSGEELLCVDGFRYPLDQELTLEDYGIKNGDRIYLI